MSIFEKVGAALLGLVCLYFCFPVLISCAVGALSRFRNQNMMYDTFDFFAELLYPWRWRKTPWKYWPLKRKRHCRGTRGMKTVIIYTDGACSGNPGPGGWGAVLLYNGHKKELSGGAAHTTNNRMELSGVIAALEALNQPCTVELYSDSKYVVDALEKGWARGWQARGWVRADKTPPLNQDLWETLLALCDRHDVKLHWVKGHAENEYNNRCDALAVMERKRFSEA